jgi:uncharacterized protein (DUF1810 family)
VPGRTASEVFGYPDDLKLRSSMTLFARVAPDDPTSDGPDRDNTVFADVLDRYFDGVPDPRTVDLLQ